MERLGDEPNKNYRNKIHTHLGEKRSTIIAQVTVYRERENLKIGKENSECGTER